MQVTLNYAFVRELEKEFRSAHRGHFLCLRGGSGERGARGCNCCKLRRCAGKVPKRVDDEAIVSVNIQKEWYWQGIEVSGLGFS